jgi:WD40 repeat protein
MLIVAVCAVAGCGSTSGGVGRPNSSAIVYSCGASLCAVSPDGSHPVQLPLPKSTNGSRGSDPVTVGTCEVDTTGTKAACPEANDHLVGDGGNYYGFHLVVVDIDGTHLHRIWEPPSGSYGPSDRYDILSGRPAWSPNGTRIAIAVPVSSLGAKTTYPIWVMGADGSSAHTVLDSTGKPFLSSTPAVVAWSPDGRHIAFETDSGGIGIVPSAGGAPTMMQQSSGEQRVATLSWSPDGSRLLGVSNDETNLLCPRTNMRLYPTTGGAPTSISVGRGIVNAAEYSPDGSRIVYTFDAGPPYGAFAQAFISNAQGADATPIPNLSMSFLDATQQWIQWSGPPNDARPPTNPNGTPTLPMPTNCGTETSTPPTTSGTFVGIKCTAVSGSPAGVILGGCDGDTGGGSSPVNLNGMGPFTIVWKSGRTTVFTGGPGSLQIVGHDSDPIGPGTCPPGSEVVARDKVVSGYTNGGPLPGQLVVAVCLAQNLVLSIEPGTQARIN